jgi:hypothetical protein
MPLLETKITHHTSIMPHDHSEHEQTPEQLEVQFEQLSLLESKFEDAESEVSK